MRLLSILSIILGLPGFVVAISLPPYRAIGILAVVIALGCVFFWRVLNLPSWTIIESQRTLQIKRADGSLATLTKRTRMRANQKGLTEFIHRNIRADGSVGNFRLDSAPVSPGDVEMRAGEYIVHERFRKMRRWRSRDSSLTYELFNSYPESTEFTRHVPDYCTKKCRIEVRFPQGRPARSPRAYTGIGAETQQLSVPDLSRDGCTISWERKGLRPGRPYTVEWDW